MLQDLIKCALSDAALAVLYVTLTCLRIPGRLYPMHGTFCIGSFFLVYYCYPETMVRQATAPGKGVTDSGVLTGRAAGGDRQVRLCATWPRRASS